MGDLTKRYAIGVFISGGHISCAVVDLQKGFVLENTFFRGMIENNASSGLILFLWSVYIKKSIEMVGMENIEGIGFAMPGPFDYENGIADFEGVPKYESLRGINIRQELRIRLQLKNDIVIHFMNDAICFALGEDWTGNAKGYSRVAAIMIGEGLGSAFIDSGKPVVVGEDVPSNGVIYNIPYKQGIADDYFSSRGILNEYYKFGEKKLNKVYSLANLALSDRRIGKVFNDFGSGLGEFLAPHLNKFNCGVLVCGGMIFDQYSLFKAGFVEALQKNNFNAPIMVSELKDHSFIVGGARILHPEYWESISSILADLD